MHHGMWADVVLSGSRFMLVTIWNTLAAWPGVLLHAVGGSIGWDALGAQIPSCLLVLQNYLRGRSVSVQNNYYWPGLWMPDDHLCACSGHGVVPGAQP